MQTDHSQGYWNVISRNYDRLKEGLDKESMKSFGVRVNEDILHDTFIKCVETVKNKDLGVKQFLNYVFMSYKRNYLRELEYSRNKLDSGKEPEEDDGGSSEMINTIDYDKFMQMVEDRFGHDDCKMFERFICGDKICDLEKEFCEKGLYYRFRKIREFLKGVIKKEDDAVEEGGN